jgi:hypothetical protein
VPDMTSAISLPVHGHFIAACNYGAHGCPA